MAKLVWLVTGCSSGFGEILVQHILARGDYAIATARRLESIKHLEEAGAKILQLDVTADQSALDGVATEAISLYGKIDVLVNNAGYVLAGAWEDIQYEQLVAQFETNVFGVFKATRAFLPHFRQKRAGTIVYISSLAGWHADGFTGPYCASKFALEGFVESLRDETESLGIKNLLVEPGRFRTHLLSPGNLKVGISKIPDYVKGSQAHADALAASDRAQAGDPSKGVEVIIDLVRGEGCAANKTVPFRIPLGTDSYDTIKDKCDESLKLLEEWKPTIVSTDY
ncbi:NAD(P)-binding protein, partial [Thozetella sp. PMI_491]